MFKYFKNIATYYIAIWRKNYLKYCLQSRLYCV